MPVQKKKSVEVEVKTATLSSTKMAIAVAFLGAAALVAAAAAGMNGRDPNYQQSQFQSEKTDQSEPMLPSQPRNDSEAKAPTSTPNALQPIIKEVKIQVNGASNKTIVVNKSLAQNNMAGSRLETYDKKSDGRVVITVSNVENAGSDLVYGYYFMNQGSSPLYPAESKYVNAFNENVVKNIKWTKSKQYGFITNSDHFTVFVLIKNSDSVNIYPLLNFDDAVVIELVQNKIISSPTSTIPVVQSPTTTAPTSTAPAAKQPILKEVSVKVNGSPKSAKTATNISAAQGNWENKFVPSPTIYTVDKTDTRVLVNVEKAENTDANTLYGYYVSYDTYYCVANNDPALKSQLIDKVKWTKSKQFTFMYENPNFFVYVLAKNGDDVFTLSNLGIDDATYLYLSKYIPPVPPEPVAPSSTFKLSWVNKNSGKLFFGNVDIGEISVNLMSASGGEVLLKNLPLTLYAYVAKPTKDMNVKVYDITGEILSSNTIKATDWTEADGVYTASLLNEFTKDNFVLYSTSQPRVLRVSMEISNNGKMFEALCANMSDANLSQVQWKYLLADNIYTGLKKGDGLVMNCLTK